MNFKFNDRDYQNDAIDSVIGIFEGQRRRNSTFTILPSDITLNVEGFDNTGHANGLEINKYRMLNNIKRIQRKNGLIPSEKFERDVNIEMETGTGKTYVYLNTICKLHTEYNLKKFIILVPGRAIMEGVNKSLEILKPHLETKHNINHISFQVLDTSDLGIVKGFVSSQDLEILIVNIDKFNKESNILNNPDQSIFKGGKPIDSIKRVNPILIIDEPQNFTSDKSKEAINNLNPLFIARYSATHVEKFPCIYKLSPIDAYNKKLVKKISVKAISPEHDFNLPNIRLLGFNKNGDPKLELDFKLKDGSNKVDTKFIKNSQIKNAVSLADITNNEKYRDYKFKAEYSFDDKYGYIEFTNGFRVELKDELLSNNKLLMQKTQIEQTVKSHLDKEKIAIKKGIKVLSLFFIDQVSNYGLNPTKRDGVFALHFENVLESLLSKEEYKSLRPYYTNIKDVHGGYFAQDKDKFKDTSGKTKADDQMYDLIMKDKESLLDLNNPLKFIFSHSTLKEGWDNPNVFQICTLNNTGKDKDVKRRQEIGRGLRLCVNKDGEVVSELTGSHKFDTLTVITNESYTEFVENLQSELDEDLKLMSRDNYIEMISKIIDADNKIMGVERATEFVDTMLESKLMSQKGKNKDLSYTKVLKEKIKHDDFDFLEEFESLALPLKHFLEREVQVIKTDNEDEKKIPKINENVANSDFIKQLEDILSRKTKYKIQFKTDDLIEAIFKDFSQYKYVSQLTASVESGDISIDEQGNVETMKFAESVNTIYNAGNYSNIDIVSKLMNSTMLTRKTIITILKKFDSEFKSKISQNPEFFIQSFSDHIKSVIKDFYTREGMIYEAIDYELNSDILLEAEPGYLSSSFPKLISAGEKSLYDYLKCDSEIEEEFMRYFEKSSNIQYYFKIPKTFKINTPVGNYSPDWAFIKVGEEKMKFIIETKSTDNIKELRPEEKIKIIAGENHFNVVSLDDVFFKDNPYGTPKRIDNL